MIRKHVSYIGFLYLAGGASLYNFIWISGQVEYHKIFSYTAFLGFILVAFSISLVFKKIILTKNELVIVIPFFTLLILVALTAFPVIVNPTGQWRFESYIKYLSLIVQWLALYFVAYHLRFDSSRFWWGLLLLSGIVVVVAFINRDPGSLIFTGRQLKHDMSTPDIYLNISSAMVLALGFFFSVTQSNLRRLGWILASVILLHMLNSRADLVFCLLIQVFVMACVMKVRQAALFTFVVVTIIVAVSVSLFWLEETDEVVTAFFGSRISSLFNLESDPSFIARIEYLRAGMIDIGQSPLVGEVGGEAKYFGPGTYIHNFLSVWRQFGFFTFIFYIYLVLISLVISFYSVRMNKSHTGKEVFTLFIAMFCLLNVLFAKSVFWPMVALSWGGGS